MRRCFSTLLERTGNGQPCVLVTVAHIAGSAPRAPGARMIVTAPECLGSIGGGNLEFEAIRIARERLDTVPDTGAVRFIELFPLGSMLQQCCGGAVFLHFEVVREPCDWLRAAAQAERDHTRMIMVSHSERQDEGAPQVPGIKALFTDAGAGGSLGEKRLDELAAVLAPPLLHSKKNSKIKLLHSLIETQSTLPDTTDTLFFEMISPPEFPLALFGAGHVGQALVNVLAGATDCRITWIDGRAAQFPAGLPSGVEVRVTENPVVEVDTLPARACCLVMTHDHQLDQDLCAALLRRNDLAFLGLIGSATKRRRFAHRLRQQGITERQLERLTCPIGIPGIESKEPGVIAVAVAAQLLQLQSGNG